ncbi:hypothetical protein M6B38_333420 [Iris pallida]|uniref:Uncharacterized protein n=1 Tax=Iris pallida TaxID=29817 RepID=A0AAX6H1U6_IRIPA|nr:hypothetical protein M6B38_333420 [Iris pallida]
MYEFLHISHSPYNPSYLPQEAYCKHPSCVLLGSLRPNLMRIPLPAMCDGAIFPKDRSLPFQAKTL